MLVQQRIYKILVQERSKKIFVEDWKKLEEIAFSMIRMCLMEQVLLEISMETTVRDLWEKLKKMYMKKNMTNKL